MGATRHRAVVLAVLTGAVIAGGLVAPGAANAAAVAPTGLSPNDPNAGPTSAVPGTPIKNIVLSWNPVAGASTYQVQVSNRSGTFEGPSVNAVTEHPSFAPSASLSRGDYAWRVRVSGGVWSSTGFFTRGWTQAPANPQFVGTDPDDDQGPVLTWDAIPDASFYEVQFSLRPYAQSPYHDAGDGGDDGEEAKSCYTANTVFTPYLSVEGEDPGITDDTTSKCIEFTGGPFYWRVRGRDGVYDPATTNLEAPAKQCTGVIYGKTYGALADRPDCSAWSYPSTQSFTIDNYVGVVAPGTPTGTDISPRTGPNTNPTVVSSTPMFAWNEVPNTTFYRVYLSRTPGMDTLDHQWDTTATKLAPVIQEPDRNVRSYWTVQACVVSETDSKGFVLTYAANKPMKVNCGDPAPWRSYVKVTPQNVDVVSTSAADGGRTFVWSTAPDPVKPGGVNGLSAKVGDVIGYDLQISDSKGSFESADQTVQVDRQGMVANRSSATLPVSSLPDGFRWRVRGVDSSRNPMPWSSDSQVGQLDSAKGSIVTGSGFGPKASLDVSFDAIVEGVTNSTLRIVADSDGKAVTGTVAKTGAAKYRFTPSGTWTAGERYRLQLTSAVTTEGASTPAVAGTGTVRAGTKVDSNSPAVSKVTGDSPWSTARASDAVGGTYLMSNDTTRTGKRSYVQTKVRGSSVAVYACMGRTSGRAGLYVDGTLVKIVNLYRSSSRCGKATTLTLSGGSAHTVRFAPMGTKVSRSMSTKVRFDAFTVA